MPLSYLGMLIEISPKYAKNHCSLTKNGAQWVTESLIKTLLKDFELWNQYKTTFGKLLNIIKVWTMELEGGQGQSGTRQ